MLRKIGIAGCLLTALLTVMPAGAFAQDRDDWRRHDRDRYRGAEYRNDERWGHETREWRDRDRREWREREWRDRERREAREHYRRGYYDRDGNWCWN